MGREDVVSLKAEERENRESVGKCGEESKGNEEK